MWDYKRNCKITSGQKNASISLMIKLLNFHVQFVVWRTEGGRRSLISFAAWDNSPRGLTTANRSASNQPKNSPEFSSEFFWEESRRRRSDSASGCFHSDVITVLFGVCRTRLLGFAPRHDTALEVQIFIRTLYFVSFIALSLWNFLPRISTISFAEIASAQLCFTHQTCLALQKRKPRSGNRRNCRGNKKSKNYLFLYFLWLAKTEAGVPLSLIVKRRQICRCEMKKLGNNSFQY